jgi:hypothetical protein
MLDAGHVLQLRCTIITGGKRPCPFRSFRIRRFAALVLRRLCTSTSRTKPSWSTARQSQMFLSPAGDDGLVEVPFVTEPAG